MNDFLFLKNGSRQDWFLSHRDDLGLDPFSRGRWPTFKVAFNLYLQRFHLSRGNIIETGCQREYMDWGAGASTYLFNKLLSRYDCGHLYSVDNNETHIARAREYVGSSDYVTFYLSDSVEFLDKFKEPIDFLYLDSFDYPICEIVREYGELDDAEEILGRLNMQTEEEILKKHEALLLPAQEHCLRELQAAHDKLKCASIILLDDNALPGGGKTRLAKQWLKKEGWTILLDYQQSLWIWG